ncbi:MAG TPA: hypothetical protein VE082_07715, partial [Desulfobaccales bacterium]|nr:hypothetical protein [Desulfobaccales bacterium]
MRQRRVTGYLAVGVVLLLTAACATYFPEFGRTSMPPPPKTPPETVSPSQARVDDLTQQVQNLETR